MCLCKQPHTGLFTALSAGSPNKSIRRACAYSLTGRDEDIDHEPFEFNGRAYLFELEYTDEELLTLENERAERDVQKS